MVTSYTENIKNNAEALEGEHVSSVNPFMAFTNEQMLADALIKEFTRRGETPTAEVRMAAHAAQQELLVSCLNMEKEGEETLVRLRETGKRAVVLTGRPYHADPEIHHGIPELITSYGFMALAEDPISHLGQVERPLVMTDQWMCHTCPYVATSSIKTQENLDLIQLNFLGYGLGVVTTDRVVEILTRSSKIYTMLKIDEVNNLGAVRIWIRSLIAALKVRDQKHYERKMVFSAYNRVCFIEEVKETYTLLCPRMSPIYLDPLKPAICSSGYKIEMLQNHSRSAVDVGSQYVDNDTCYPSLIAIGQIMDALLLGRYDLDHTAVPMSQTGGNCCVSNYVGLIHHVLEGADMSQTLVVSVNADGMETNPGFTFTAPLLTKAMQVIVYDDVFMRILYATRPYEAEPDSANVLHEKWKARCIQSLSRRNAATMEFGRNTRGIIWDFDDLPRRDVRKPKVGIVGEILVKFSPLTNSHIVELLESGGAGAVIPGLMDFLPYSFYNDNFKAGHLGTKKSTARLCNAGAPLLEYFRRTAKKEPKVNICFTSLPVINELAGMAKGFVPLGNQTDEEWFLAGGMPELIHSGVNSITCTQPSSCLPNHIVGRGMIKGLHRHCPQSNIIAVDYDPGASEVSQSNRIGPIFFTAQKNLKQEKPAEPQPVEKRHVSRAKTLQTV